MAQVKTHKDICGKAHDALPALERVLKTWLKLMKADWGKGDAPWWYNERASVSQLAGALWLSRAWVFEEYSVNRKSPAGKHDGDRVGRCDLMFELGDLHVVAEAKQLWLAQTNGKNARRRVDEALQHAWKDVWTAPDVAGRYRRFGLVFVTPWVRKKLVSTPDTLAERLRAFVEEMRAAYPQAALAWAFPGEKRHLLSKRYAGRYYPGVLMILAPYSASSTPSV